MDEYVLIEYIEEYHPKVRYERTIKYLPVEREKPVIEYEVKKRRLGEGKPITQLPDR